MFRCPKTFESARTKWSLAILRQFTNGTESELNITENLFQHYSRLLSDFQYSRRLNWRPRLFPIRQMYRNCVNVNFLSFFLSLFLQFFPQSSWALSRTTRRTWSVVQAIRKKTSHVRCILSKQASLGIHRIRVHRHLLWGKWLEMNSLLSLFSHPLQSKHSFFPRNYESSSDIDCNSAISW